jgi:hypothetical protein
MLERVVLPPYCDDSTTRGKKDGTVTYLQNGVTCLTSQKNAKSFLPLVVESSQYGGKTTLSNIKVTHG